MTINIRDIQHYMYCPRRFALLNADYSWQENAFTVIANIIHNRVHSGKHKLYSQSKYELSDIYVYNDVLDILGKVDCLEFKRNSNGTYIKEFDDKFDINIIEYKPTKPKSADYNATDAIQVYAQKLCVDYIFKCSADMYIYYENVKRRFKICNENAFDKLVEEYIAKMDYILENNIIPEAGSKQKCSGCSMIDICMPKVKAVGVKEAIYKIISQKD